MARALNFAAGTLSAVAVIAVSQSFEILGWLTRHRDAAQLAHIRAERIERLWNTRPDL